MARLATGVWVSAYLMRLSLEGISAHLVKKGDPTAGAVAVKLAFMNGRASFYTRGYGPDGKPCWMAQAEEAEEPEVDAALARQRSFDPDLWVIEVEDPRGRHMLDAPGLEA
ncbi:MAG TPA: DUF1491 family protein [Thermohalobaculum sp.]|nr:DUF1491 family protein [Thermohalobaculum sp.]